MYRPAVNFVGFVSLLLRLTGWEVHIFNPSRSQRLERCYKVKLCLVGLFIQSMIVAREGVVIV